MLLYTRGTQQEIGKGEDDYPDHAENVKEQGKRADFDEAAEKCGSTGVDSVDLANDISSKNQKIKATQEELFKHITISQDQTSASDYKRERLAVLSSEKNELVRTSLGNVKSDVLFRTTHTNDPHALQDYQMQLMLLEQRRAKREKQRELQQQQQLAYSQQQRVVQQGLPNQHAMTTDMTTQALLKDHFIDPNTLTQSQLQTFQQQNPEVQKRTLEIYSQNLAAQYRNKEPRAVTGSQGGVTSDIPENARMVASAVPNSVTSGMCSSMTPVSSQGHSQEWYQQRHLIPVSQSQPEEQGANQSDPIHWQRWQATQSPPLTTTRQSKFCKGGSSALPVLDIELKTSGDAPAHFICSNKEDTIQTLLKRLENLELENKKLRESYDLPQSQHSQVPKVEPKFQVLHRIQGIGTFLEEPSWIIKDGRKATLRGNLALSNPSIYLERHSDLSFVVYKEYDPSKLDHDNAREVLEDDVVPRPVAQREYLKFISDDMLEAVKDYFRHISNLSQANLPFGFNDELEAPYLFWYHYRSSLPFVIHRLKPHHQGLMHLLNHWINSNYGQEYEEAHARISDGYVSPRYMKYLFRPGEVLVSKHKARALGHIGQSFTKDTTIRRSLQDYIESTLDYDKQRSINEREAIKSWSWQVQAWSYSYDGSFSEEKVVLDIKLSVEKHSEEVRVEDLEVLPLRFANPDVRKRLEKRGRTFWSCQGRKLVSCLVVDHDGLDGDRERFMVDYSTYKTLHPGDSGPGHLISAGRPENDPGRAAKDEPPPGDELLVFPPTLIGYNLQKKKWIDLDVDRISDVVWNKKAFESLVVENETKELIQALVTNQLKAEQSTDLISGKGNGLIILLHGGPGTGKTFTAESVAELAEKPLYRVTCGDIGTKPEAVEKYLESVLYLGKIWDCVVLLDEADVFLEQRSLADLSRNALVSVFLRVLEYYDGILILTSNRVGTFDEAFKSRIQLALHYENLTVSQRSKIWKNFINQLRHMGEQNIDFDDVECYITELAGQQMNGREIRNAITIARQLAQFKGQALSYSHLKHVTGVAGKFDKYLKDVRVGATDDQIMRDDGIR